MKISIIIPVALKATDSKRGAMLIDCLQSILHQTHTDYDVVVKDAFPHEPVTLHAGVRETMRLFGRKLNYIAFADKNITDGVNQALWWTTGDILHYTCGDDLAHDPDTLAYVNDKFATCDMTKPNWLYGSTFCVNEDGTEGPWGVQPWATLEETLIHNRMGCGATFWNRAMMDRIGFWQTKYKWAADYDYWCRCYRVTVPMYTTRCLGACRRWNECASRINSEDLEVEAQSMSVDNTAAHARGDAPSYIPYQQ